MEDDDVLFTVLSNMSVPEICRLAAVNKRFGTIAVQTAAHVLRQMTSIRLRFHVQKKNVLLSPALDRHRIVVTCRSHRRHVTTIASEDAVWVVKNVTIRMVDRRTLELTHWHQSGAETRILKEQMQVPPEWPDLVPVA